MGGTGCRLSAKRSRASSTISHRGGGPPSCSLAPKNSARSARPCSTDHGAGPETGERKTISARWASGGRGGPGRCSRSRRRSQCSKKRLSRCWTYGVRSGYSHVSRCFGRTPRRKTITPTCGSYPVRRQQGNPSRDGGNLDPGCSGGNLYLVFRDSTAFQDDR